MVLLHINIDSSNFCDIKNSNDSWTSLRSNCKDKTSLIGDSSKKKVLNIKIDDIFTRKSPQKIKPKLSPSSRKNKSTFNKKEFIDEGRPLFPKRESPGPVRAYQIKSASSKNYVPPLTYHKVTDLKHKKVSPFTARGTGKENFKKKVPDQDEQKIVDMCWAKLMKDGSIDPNDKYTMTIKTKEENKGNTSQRLFTIPVSKPEVQSNWQ